MGSGLRTARWRWISSWASMVSPSIRSVTWTMCSGRTATTTSMISASAPSASMSPGGRTTEAEPVDSVAAKGEGGGPVPLQGRSGSEGHEGEVCLPGHPYALRKLAGRCMGPGRGEAMQDDIHRQKLEQGGAHQRLHGVHGKVIEDSYETGPFCGAFAGLFGGSGSVTSA